MNDDQYYTGFGMDKDPFSAITSDSDYFLTPELEHRIELIKHLVEFSDRIVVVTGEAGSGKTSLLNHLIYNPDEKWNRCRLEFNNINSVEDFFSQLYQDQNIEYRELDSYASKVTVLQEYFSSLQFKGYIPVIFIDDAHYLSIEILKLLFELAITPQKKPCLHIVLFSETRIADLVNHKNLGYIHSLDMPVFDEQQTLHYIQHRLNEAGFSGAMRNADKSMKQIYRTSSGLPGLVNELAAQALQDPALQPEEKKPVTQLQTVLLNPRYTMPAALVLLAAFMTYIFYAEPESTPATPEQQIVELPELPEEEDPAAIDEPTEQATTIIVDEPEISVPVDDEGQDPVPKDTLAAEPAKQNEATEPNEEMIETESAHEQLIEIELQPSAPEVTDREPETVVDMSVPEPTEIVVLNTKGEIVTSIKPAQSDLNQPAEEQKEDQEEIAEAVSTIVPEAETQVEQPEAPKPVPVAVEEEKIKETRTVAPAEIRGPSWLKQQPPDHYVLQLMGAHDGTAMNKFIEQHSQFRGDFAKFKTVNQNKIWYVLVYGKYKTRDEAVAAVPALPPVLRDLKPWPRRIQTIQQDL